MACTDSGSSSANLNIEDDVKVLKSSSGSDCSCCHLLGTAWHNYLRQKTLTVGAVAQDPKYEGPLTLKTKASTIEVFEGYFFQKDNRTKPPSPSQPFEVQRGIDLMLTSGSFGKAQINFGETPRCDLYGPADGGGGSVPRNCNSSRSKEGTQMDPVRTFGLCFK